MAYNPPLSLFFLLLLLFLIHCCSHFSFFSTLPDPYLKSIPIALHPSIVSDEYLELTKPFPSDPLNPSCHLLLLQKDFGNTIGTAPVSVHYSPTTDCPGPWTHITLEFHVTCHGEQYKWISGLWLDGIEILRTSSLETTKSGIAWKVRKDVTRYSSLFSQSNITLTMKLKNMVNEVVYNGVYNVNITLLYYYYGDNETTVSPSHHQVTELRLNRKGGVLTEKTADQIHDGDVFVIEELENSERRLGFHYDETKTEVDLPYQEPCGNSNRRQKSHLLYEMPADLIIPISDDRDEGFWFQIQNELVHSKRIQIPLNTYRAVLEIYVSSHGNDEFWYSNPPKSYIGVNDLSAGRGNGAFRQVFTTIDRVLVGSTIPFPVIYTGGINMMFSEPVVPIGALDLPSYDLDLTPFLGILLDGKSHSFGFGVTDSLPFWLVDANLHLWVDPCSPTVQANTVLQISEPSYVILLESNFGATFEIEAKRNAKFSGWVSSSMGNFTTQVSEEFEFKNEIKLKRHGQLKEVEQKMKVKTEVTVVKSDTGELIHGAIIERKYPLSIKTSTRPGLEQHTCLLINKLSQALNKKTTLTSPTEEYSSSYLSKSQDSRGWMVVRDHHRVLFGKASTQQTLSYKDEISCYSRTVSATDGKVLEDTCTIACASSS